MPDSETFFQKLTSINFTVKNNSPNRKIKVFNYPIYPGQTRDLLAIPEISEADIRHSLIKGELANFIRNGTISIVSTSIDLNQFDSEQQSFINNAGGIEGVSSLFGEISLQDVSGTQTLTTQNTFYVINQWTTNQNTQGVTPSFSNGTLTIGYPGWYLTTFNCSMQSANNLNFKAALFVNGTIHENGKSQFSTSGITGTPTINVTISDVNQYNAGDVLDIRVTCTSASVVQFVVLQANFFVVSM
jgi:hypothetical protein